MTPELIQAMQSVRFIAQHIKDADKDNEVCLKLNLSSFETARNYRIKMRKKPRIRRFFYKIHKYVR